jgi:hypothetical protein
MLVKQVSDTCFRALLEEFLNHGLSFIIREAQDVVDEFLRSGEVYHALWREFYRVLLMRPAYDILKSVSYLEAERLEDATAEREFLQVLRFPKRFSWVDSKVLEREQLNAFEHQEDVNSELATHLPSEIPLILKDLRTLMRSVVDWEKIKEDLQSTKFKCGLLPLTPGDAADAATMSKKIRKLSKVYPQNFPEPFSPITSHLREWEYRDQTFYWTPVKVSCVPKSYKAYRTIAPEPIARGSAALRVMRVLEKHLPMQIPIHDQTIMTERAREASISGDYSTLDLSAASDCVTKWLVSELVPRWFWNTIEELIPWHVTLKGETRPLRSFATMGNPLTFVVESLVFYVIDLYAIELCNVWYEEVPDSPKLPWVYGDDQIVPTYAAEATIDVLTRLGFRVNKEKSFYDPKPHTFRESCGGDYWDGYKVSTLYWPRRAIEITLEQWKARDLRDKPFRKGRDSQLTSTASVLVALEQRLFQVNLDAAMFVLSVLWYGSDDISTNVAGTVGLEPWGLHHDPHTCATAYAEWVDVEQTTVREYPVFREKLRWRGLRYDFSYWEIIPNGYKTWTTKEVVGRRLKGVRCPIESREPCGYAPVVRAKPIEAKDRSHAEDWYVYQLFLSHGPFYPTPLDKLLGVSKSWYSTLVGEPEASIDRIMR